MQENSCGKLPLLAILNFLNKKNRAATRAESFEKLSGLYLENIGPAKMNSDWLILVIGPLIYLSRVIISVIYHTQIRFNFFGWTRL